MNVLRAFGTLCFLLASVPVLAGGDREGYSKREGVFFVEAEQGELTYISFDSPQHAIALQKHCQHGDFVFSHASRKRYRCKVKDSSIQVGDAPGSGSQAIEVIGASADLKANRMLYALFTTQPVQRTVWKIRPLSVDEQAGIATFIEASKERYKYLSRYVATGKGFAVHKVEGQKTTYFIPGKWVKDSEGFYEAQRHHVFVGEGGRYQYQGQLPDKPTRYHDLDGDALPEIETSESCDGWCIGLWDISRAPQEIARYGGH